MGELVNRLLRKIKYIQEGAEFDAGRPHQNFSKKFIIAK